MPDTEFTGLTNAPIVTALVLIGWSAAVTVVAGWFTSNRELR